MPDTSVWYHQLMQRSGCEGALIDAWIMFAQQLVLIESDISINCGTGTATATETGNMDMDREEEGVCAYISHLLAESDH